MTVVVKLAPLPTGMLSYVLGCTPVSANHFALGSIITAAPYCALTCFVAASAVHWDRFWDTFFKSPPRVAAFALVVTFIAVAVLGISLRLRERYRELLMIV